MDFFFHLNKPKFKNIKLNDSFILKSYQFERKQKHLSEWKARQMSQSFKLTYSCCFPENPQQTEKVISLLKAGKSRWDTNYSTSSRVHQGYR